MIIITRRPLKLVAMEGRVISRAVSPEPMGSFPAIQPWVGAVVQSRSGLLGADVDSIIQHVTVAAGLHQVDLA